MGDFDVKGQQGMDFFTCGSVVMDYGLVFSTLMGLFLTNTRKMIIDGLEGCGLLWCFYQLSFWRHPFTAKDPLMRKLCKATFLQICSDEQKLIFIFDGLRACTYSGSFNFGWTGPLMLNKMLWWLFYNLVHPIRFWGWKYMLIVFPQSPTQAGETEV